MFHEARPTPIRRVLLAAGGPHGDAAARIAGRLARDRSISVTTFVPPVDGDTIPALLRAAAEGYDLVVAGVGDLWALPMSVFDVREHPLVTELSCSLLAVHGSAQATKIASLEIDESPTRLMR
jgi:hypothetical protein